MVELSPERAIEIQNSSGSDIAMQLDECLRLPRAPRRARTRYAACRSRWAERSKRAFRASGDAVRAALFGIVQGGDDPQLRVESARALTAYRVPWLRHRRAGRGRATGRDAAHGCRGGARASRRPSALSHGRRNARRYAGRGGAGIDMFDCVLSTRNGRHGLAFTRLGRSLSRTRRHADDPRPLDGASACAAAARDYSRAYLHHLVKANEMLGAILLTTVNGLLPGADGGHACGDRGRSCTEFCAQNTRRLGAQGEART